MVRLVGQSVTVVAVAVAGGVCAPGGVGDADGEGGGSGGDGEGAGGDVTGGGGVATGVDGEGGVPGRCGCNVLGPDGVVVVRVL